MRHFYLFILFTSIFFSCNQEIDNKKTLFTLISPKKSGIHFINALKVSEEVNMYTYRNFYNGGGVAVGDINNDGFPDVFFSGNQVSNKLYLNKGNFEFQDITISAGLNTNGVWSTGVSMADINGDGLLDIYVCKSGPPSNLESRKNALFINNGNLTFTDQAEDYGIDDKGLSTHAIFFDYDRDGDLDMYLLNNSLRSVGGYDLIEGQREIRDTLGANKLYENLGDHFEDVSEKAGIYGSSIGFGLGVSIGDINRDNWPDIFVSNDFFERDYLYLNQKDGTFKEILEESIQDISMGSMGADIADINNDGYPEIFVTEMLPESDRRYKTKTVFDSWDKYQLMVKKGYYHQFGRNVLQLNNQDGTFSEIGRYAGVEATDWSWGALIFDMDNDGNRDIFVANGIFKDLLDQDYINYKADPASIRELISSGGKVMTKLVDMIPSEPISNYAFINRGDLKFENRTKELGLGKPSYSSGSAYADFDNDGDLDLVLNNTNQKAYIFRNNSNELNNHHFIKVQFIQDDKNKFGYGAQINAYSKEKMWFAELNPMRGFQSNVEPIIHLGLGEVKLLDSLRIFWPSGGSTSFYNVQADSTYIIKRGENLFLTDFGNQSNQTKTLFSKDKKLLKEGLKYKESKFVDFDHDRLLFNMRSNLGPCACKGDINNDGNDDFYIGGAKGEEGKLFLYDMGKYIEIDILDFSKNKSSEDTDCIFIDFNGDGYQDLFVTSGGFENAFLSENLKDRLYINTKSNSFELKLDYMVNTYSNNSSTVSADDIDNDGDYDLFIGSSAIHNQFGTKPSGILLQNDGNANFKDVTNDKARCLQKVGIIRDSKWVNLDDSPENELIIIGEYMPLMVFSNDNGRFKLVSTTNLFESKGLWNCLEVADLNNDGLLDIIAGNYGLNSRFHASKENPLQMYVADFDMNGKIEQIICSFNGEGTFPIVRRDELIRQIPVLKKKYLKYEDYINQTIYDIFGEEAVSNAEYFEANTLASTIFYNLGNLNFSTKELSMMAQLSTTYDILAEDFNNDGNIDLLLGGNQYKIKPELGPQRSSYGTILIGNGLNQFDFLNSLESGIIINGSVRSILNISLEKKNCVFIFKNDYEHEVYSY